LDWFIIGQRTPVSAKTKPNVEWIREIVDAADKNKTPVFLKDNLIPMIDELPDNCFNTIDCGEQVLRQEFPIVRSTK